MQWIIKKIIGTKNDRDVKRLRPLVDEVNRFAEEYATLSDDQLKAKTPEFKKRLADGETVDDLMCEAFAVVKDACRRLCREYEGRTIEVSGQELTWEMVPYDVQVIGGIVLHRGMIAEMATGEGKTLVATMPVYLNGLTGRGVHVVTVNDYLAQRDSEWMGLVYRYLGLTVGCLQNNMPPDQRREHYGCDITYGTNSEFGFDYLRDNMTYSEDEQVHRDYHYAVVDEIDSILIDEARTPLIISGPAPYSTSQYRDVRAPVERLVRRQRELCTRLIQEIKKHLEAEEFDAAQLKLYQVNQGNPENKQFLKMLEDPAIRKMLEKIDGQMLTDMYKEQARDLREELFFTIDEKGHDASLTDKGSEALNPDDPESYMLPDLAASMSDLDGDESMTIEDKTEKKQELQKEFADRSERIHAVDQLIRAFCVYEKDVDYVVQNNQVIIVDENTGRLMPGRRWSDGLHQAVEAKENVKIERETQTLATITIQNYFRMYEKLSGMTGTAETEADEFHQIYKLDVVVIPTNRPVRRVDLNDQIYKTSREKFNAVADEIETCQKRGQPVLVGTISVETSELLSRILRRKNVQHSVLNAKHHQREAEIVARAGQPGAVTIATNMAGRGTDIKLGKGVVYLEKDILHSDTSLHDKVDGRQLQDILEERPCGLHVIGTERHESRRIDRQLRGRCARQGDPGSSRFYVSLEDDLMRLFGSDRISGVMEKLGLEEGEVLEHPWLNRSIETAQRRVEQQNFSIRKRTLEYDDVMNKQREIIYGFRTEVLKDEQVREDLYEMVEDIVLARATEYAAQGEEGKDEFMDWVSTTFPIALDRGQLPAKSESGEEWAEPVIERIRRAYELKVQAEDEEALHAMEKYIILQAVDLHWQEYLRNMDALRQGVGLRAYGQRDPLVEYKHEAYDMFADLMDRIKADVATRMFRSATSMRAMNAFISSLPQSFIHAEASAMAQAEAQSSGQGADVQGPRARPRGADAAFDAAAGSGGTQTVRRNVQKVGRNDPCPCGSGKKYKKCCGAA